MAMELTFYSNKAQREETLILEPTEGGWYLMGECYKGQCDPGGRPYLQRCIEQNDSSFPAAFPDAMEELWEAFLDGRLKNRNIQERLHQFSGWLKAYQKESTIKLSDFSP